MNRNELKESETISIDLWRGNSFFIPDELKKKSVLENYSQSIDSLTAVSTQSDY